MTSGLAVEPGLSSGRRRINIRHWPGREGWRPPREPAPAERLRHRLVLYLVSLAELGALPERFGLGASLLCVGGVILDACLVFDDELDRAGRQSVSAWAETRCNWVETATGPRSYKVVSLSEFNRGVLYRHGYIGRVTIAGIDLGRSLGLHADWWRAARRRRWTEAWVLGLRGWGVPSAKDPSRWVRSTGRPYLYVQGVSAYGLRAAFGKARPSFDDGGKDAEPRGAWERRVQHGSTTKVPYAGRFVEVAAAGHALFGVDSDQLDHHLVAAGIAPVHMPFALRSDPEGAEVVTRTVRALQRLALVLDDAATRWAGSLDLRWLWSPGATAAQLLSHMGVAPPLAAFDLSDDELSHWTAGLYGGWVSADPAGLVFPGIDIDVRSAYPAIAALLGWWNYVTASQLLVSDVRGAFEAFLSAPDLAARMREKTTWRHWGLTRVVLRLDGQPVPLDLVNEDASGSRMFVVPTRADRYDCTWPDAVTATVFAGRPVEVLDAVQLVPVGRQEGLRAIEIPGAPLLPEHDPVVTMVQRRRLAKAEGDARLAAAIRVITNAMVYGNFARFDPDPVHGERPGPWCFPPIAASVAAGCRALLALFDAGVCARGGIVPYRDTDGAIPAVRLRRDAA